MEFSDRLKNIRFNKSLTQLQMAKELGMSLRMYGYYENGKFNGHESRIGKYLHKLAYLEGNEVLLQKPVFKRSNLDPPEALYFTIEHDKAQYKFIPVYEDGIHPKDGQKDFMIDREIKPVAFFSVNKFDDCDYWYTVHGDDMIGKYSPGRYLVVSRANPHKIMWGKVYYIIFNKESGYPSVTRFVHKSNLPGSLLLKAANPTFEDADVDISDIMAIFLVKGDMGKDS